MSDFPWLDGVADLSKELCVHGQIVVKVHLKPEQRKLLETIGHGLGMDESEALRYAFMDYAKSLSLVTEKAHRKL